VVKFKTSTLARELVGRSVAIARAQELVRRAALGDGGVLLVADRGADVESVAHELHERNRRSAGPFERVECASPDSGGLDRLLFGAPAGVVASDLEWVSSDSRIAAACGGTVFLQDVADMPAAVQARIARVARDGEVRIEGDPTTTNVRWIASAAPGIDADVHAGRFRGDLYRRLAASRIDLPPLRDRAEDVPALASRLLDDWSAAHGCAPRTMTQPALALLSALTWPGNVADLRLVVERAAKDAPHDVIQIEDLLPALKLDRLDHPNNNVRNGVNSLNAVNSVDNVNDFNNVNNVNNVNRAPTRFVFAGPAGNLRDARLRFERDYISAVLHYHGWRMAEAAHVLGIQRPNLYRKARQLGIPLARTSE
jgi:DNA-binding NtrC family response regulator